MRTTVDLPDELFRHAKAEAAMRGRKLKDLIEDGLRLILAAPPAGDEPPAKKNPSMHELAKHLILEDADSPRDLSTNPKYFEGFGR